MEKQSAEARGQGEVWGTPPPPPSSTSSPSSLHPFKAAVCHWNRELLFQPPGVFLSPDVKNQTTCSHSNWKHKTHSENICSAPSEEKCPSLPEGILLIQLQEVYGVFRLHRKSELGVMSPLITWRLRSQKFFFKVHSTKSNNKLYLQPEETSSHLQMSLW